MTHVRVSAIGVAVTLVATILGASVGRAQGTAAATVLRGFGVDERLDAPSALIAALDSRKLPTLHLFVRLAVDRQAIATAVGRGSWEALDARIGAYQKQSVPVLLRLVAGAISAGDDSEWRTLARALAARYGTRIAGYQFELAAGAPRPDARTYAYLLRTVAVAIRSVAPQPLIAQATIGAADRAWQSALYAEETAAYVDVVPVDAHEIEPGEGLSALRDLVARHDPGSVVLEAGRRLTGSGTEAVGRWLAFALSRLGDPNGRFTIAGDADDVAAALVAAGSLPDLFAGDLTTLQPANVKLVFAVNGEDVTTRVPHRLFYNLANDSTYLAYWSTPPGQEIVVTLLDASRREPMARDALRRSARPVTGFAWSPDSKATRFVAPAATSPIVLDFNYGAATVFVSRAEAATTSLPSVAEVVFRHQQAQLRQESLYRHFIASARMEQKFRAGTESFNVVSENRFFSARDGVEWEEQSFEVNGGRFGPDRPAFPLLQAEKVLSLPLDLRLTADYVYHLDGTDEVDGRRCYVVAFDPVDTATSRYRGRIWIDAETYVRMRLNAIQTRLDGLIVSSEEVHTFAPAAKIGDESLLLTRRVATTQQILIAGQNVQLEKVVTFGHFEIDAPDFAARRQMAREGSRIMFRDTPQGVRYFVKRDGERVVSDRLTTSSKALAMGAAIDPSFDYPLPLVGLNYLDFSFLGEGSQLALLWGGPLALGNIQKPQFGGVRSLDVNLDFFVLAAPSASSVFDRDGERRGERVLTIPMSTGLNLGYQLGAFQKIRVGYQFRYDAFFADGATATSFAVPASTATHGVAVDYKFARRGYAFGATASAYRRPGWRSWGLPATFDANTAGYRRHSVSAAKDFFLTTFQTLRTAISWHGGDGLDRFSMYQFGLFDEVRMHGVPAAGLRFPELVLARFAYSFNVFDIYRLDLFFDRAAGRDPDARGVWHPVTGTGVALNLRAPWQTMFRADVGRSFVPDRYAGAGCWVVQLMLLKPL